MTTFKSETKEILIGFLALSGLATVLVLSYSGGQIGPVRGLTISAIFNRTDGLAVGNEIHLGGVRVGTVIEQRLWKDSYRAEVIMHLDKDIKLPADTSAAIHTDDLFGTKFVILEPGGEEEILKNGDQITFTQGSLVVEELLELIIVEGKGKRPLDKDRHISD